MNNSTENAYDAYENRPIGGGGANAYQSYDDRPIGGSRPIQVEERPFGGSNLHSGPMVFSGFNDAPRSPPREVKKREMRKQIEREENAKTNFLKRGQGTKKYDPRDAIKKSKEVKKKSEEEKDRIR